VRLPETLLKGLKLVGEVAQRRHPKLEIVVVLLCWEHLVCRIKRVGCIWQPNGAEGLAGVLAVDVGIAFESVMQSTIAEDPVEPAKPHNVSLRI
jgi:hypothetical protein